MSEIKLRDADNGWILSYNEEIEPGSVVTREIVFEVDDFVNNECEVFKTVLYQVLNLLGPNDARSDFSPTQIHIELKPGDELDSGDEDGKGNEDQ